MLSIEIKNFRTIDLQNLVLDLNGTITCDGILISGIADRIQNLKPHLNIYLISADTHGNAKKIAEELGIKLIHLNQITSEKDQKASFINSINPDQTIAIGNGQNDIKMLKLAKLGIGIIGQEGMCSELFSSVKIIVTSPNDALDLILQPKRINATLRD